jgi:DNA-directed RNA polymerase specialized sigma24 family protein
LERLLRVRAHRISPNDLEDIRQNVFLHIIQNRTLVVSLPPVALDAFIDRSVARYAKHWKRYHKRFKPLEAEHEPLVNEGERNESGLVTLRLDMATVLRI